jgi:hypothetical protein
LSEDRLTHYQSLVKPHFKTFTLSNQSDLRWTVGFGDACIEKGGALNLKIG